MLRDAAAVPTRSAAWAAPRAGAGARRARSALDRRRAGRALARARAVRRRAAGARGPAGPVAAAAHDRAVRRRRHRRASRCTRRAGGPSQRWLVWVPRRGESCRPTGWRPRGPAPGRTAAAPARGPATRRWPTSCADPPADARPSLATCSTPWRCPGARAARAGATAARPCDGAVGRARASSSSRGSTRRWTRTPACGSEMEEADERPGRGARLRQRQRALRACARSSASGPRSS